MYSRIYGPNYETTMHDASVNSEDYEGKTIIRPVRLVTQVSDNELVFRDGKGTYTAILSKINREGLPGNGAYVSFKGIFHSGKLYGVEYHIHKYRCVKIVSSLLACIGVIIYSIIASTTYLIQINCFCPATQVISTPFYGTITFMKNILPKNLQKIMCKVLKRRI
jgi:hypothetical protein